MAAVAAGIRHVQATINGYGERAGNANMVSILANLALKTPHALVPAGGGQLAGLTELSRSVAEIANVNPNDYQPYVGRSAFAHKGGVHGAAVAKVERSYQHVDPGLVGNAGRLVVSELGGRANTALRAEQLGHQLEGVDPRELSNLIKQLESEGLAFEGAEASFELLIRRHASDYVAPFRIVDYTCIVEQRDGRELLAEATVKVEVDGEILHTAADGNGPVNALDAALRKALGAFYPGIDDVHLVDYKVRILDGGAATAARTRVVIDSSADGRTWSTMGSDTNIIAASAGGAGRLPRVRDLGVGRRTPSSRRAALHGTGPGRRRAGRPPYHGGSSHDRRDHRPAPDPLDGHVRQQQPEPWRGGPRGRRPALARFRPGQRPHRCAVSRPWTRRSSPSWAAIPDCSRTTSTRWARGRTRSGPSRSGSRHRPGKGSAAPATTSAKPAARTSSRPASRRTSGRSTRCSARPTGPGAAAEAATAPVAPAARSAAPVSPGTARERRADLDEVEGEHDTTAWFER